MDAHELLYALGYTTSEEEYEARRSADIASCAADVYGYRGVYRPDELYIMPLNAATEFGAQDAFLVIEHLFRVMTVEDIERSLMFTFGTSRDYGRRGLFRKTTVLTLVAVKFVAMITPRRGREAVEISDRGRTMALGLFDLILTQSFSTERLTRFWLGDARSEFSKLVRNVMKSPMIDDALPLLMAHLPGEYFTKRPPQLPAGQAAAMAVEDIGVGIVTVLISDRTLGDISEKTSIVAVEAFQEALGRTPLDQLRQFDSVGDNLPLWLENVLTITVFTPRRFMQSEVLRERMLHAIISRMGYIIEDRARGTSTDLRTYIRGLLEEELELEDDEDMPEFIAPLFAHTSVKKA